MRVEVGAVRTISALALLAAGVACLCGMLVPVTGPPDWLSGLAPRLVAGYGLTLLSFAAFPRSRRTDLVRLGACVAILAEMLLLVLGRGFGLAHVAAETAGAFAVLVPSFMERFRSLTRADPHERFSMVYPNDRRRRAPRSLKNRGLAGTPALSSADPAR